MFEAKTIDKVKFANVFQKNTIAHRQTDRNRDRERLDKLLVKSILVPDSADPIHY